MKSTRKRIILLLILSPTDRQYATSDEGNNQIIVCVVGHKPKMLGTTDVDNTAGALEDNVVEMCHFSFLPEKCFILTVLF